MTEPDAPVPPPLGDAARLLAEAAQLEARSLGHSFVGMEHILLALLADPALAAAAAAKGAPDREELRKRLAAASSPRSVATGGEFGLSPQARRLLEGTTSLNRADLLERIVGNPRGPLAKLLGREKETRGAGREAQPEEAGGDAKPTDERREPRKRPDRREEKREEPRREPRRERQEKLDRPRSPTRERPVIEAPIVKPAPARPPASPPARPKWLTLRNVALLLVPATVVLNAMHANPLLVFVVACLGVIPLAGYMGEATEHLASRTGPAIGGLLNATFGNAAELIIAVVALRAGFVQLVKASITGSILGNLLLIMGLCFVAGGTKQATLRFNRVSAGAAAGMLSLAVAGLIFPALFHHLHPEAGALRELMLSETVAVVLAITYLLSLIFSLKTHKPLFGGEPHPQGGEVWGPLKAIIVLAIATSGVVVQSEILVHATETVTSTMGLSETFLGLIIVPIIGNAAEHATAVVVARKGQMDLALQIALGSSTQVALLVAPVLVLVGLIVGQRMDLVFSTFEIAAVGLTVVVTAILTADGESNWFEGAQLLAMYALVAAMAFFV
jgi:Ca2+:H+ antiporter